MLQVALAFWKMIEVVQVLVVQNLQLFSIFLSAGGITFGDFMEFLSIMSKGTTKEKILWSFDFLDIDRNGHIEKQELTKVTLSDSNNVQEYVYQIFLCGQVLEAVYEMVLPGNNISQSEVHSQVGRKHKHPYCQQCLESFVFKSKN